jgi:hypothetical protein
VLSRTGNAFAATAQKCCFSPPFNQLTSSVQPCCVRPAGLPASTINEHLSMLLDAAQTAKSPAPLARNVMALYEQ